MTSTNRNRSWQLTRLGLVAAAAAALFGCGGGGDDLDAADNPTIGSVVFALPPTGGTNQLDLGNPTLVLGAALSAISAGSEFGNSTYSDLGSAPPGSGTSNCDSGRIRDTAAVAGANREASLEFDQCFDSDADGQALFDGTIRVRSSTSGGTTSARVETNIGNEFVRGAVLTAGNSQFDFFQLNAIIDFPTASNALRQATTLGGRYLIGEATAVSGTALVPSKYVEVLAGTSSTSFAITVDGDDESDYELSVSGPMSIQGTGLTAPCNVASAAFNVATNDAVLIDVGVEDDRPISGLLSISNSNAQNATVQFNGTGGATVIVSGGGSTTFNATQVETVCGFEA